MKFELDMVGFLQNDYTRLSINRDLREANQRLRIVVLNDDELYSLDRTEDREWDRLTTDFIIPAPKPEAVLREEDEAFIDGIANRHINR